MGRDPLMEALNDAYLLGEENENRLERGYKPLPVDEELKKIKERYFF